MATTMQSGKYGFLVNLFVFNVENGFAMDNKAYFKCYMSKYAYISLVDLVTFKGRRVVQSSTRSTLQQDCLGFKPRMDRSTKTCKCRYFRVGRYAKPK